MLTQNTKKNFNFLIPVVVALISIAYYLISTQWQVLEILSFIAGIIALWVPLGALFYIKCKKEIEDQVICFTFSFIASYCTTTLIYFLLAVLHIENLFYFIQFGILIWLITKVIHKQLSRKVKFDFIDLANKVDWILIALLTITLVVLVPYQIGWKYSPADNDYILNVFSDQTYFTSQAYELMRHVPPLQESVRAGIPERAYHMFPHLTTMLISKYTHQNDMLRVNLVYHCSIISIGICLSLYSIVKILTKNKIAAHVAMTTMYIAAIEFPPIIQDKTNSGLYFYFTLFPHYSSGIGPSLILSPQTHSGILIVYGFILGVLLISLRCYRRLNVENLLIITAIVLGATIRFRALEFLPMLPSFILIALYGWRKTNQKIYLFSILISLFISSLLYFEMKSPVYLQGTTNITIGFNGLTDNLNNLINSWPLSVTCHKIFTHLFGSTDLRNHLWQIFSTVAFVGLNIIGIPVIVCSYIFFSTTKARKEYILFSVFLILLTIFSIVGGIFLKLSYENWSLGGEMILLPGLYLFVLLIPGLFQVYLRIKATLFWSKTKQLSILLTFLTIFFIINILQSNSHTLHNLLVLAPDRVVRIGSNEKSILDYIRINIPLDSVILSNKYYPKYNFVISGISGRTAYLEGAEATTLDSPMFKQYNLGKRVEIINDLWLERNPPKFCELLKEANPTTHLIEYSNQPLLVSNPYCLKLTKEIAFNPMPSNETVKLWEIIKK